MKKRADETDQNNISVLQLFVSDMPITMVTVTPAKMRHVIAYSTEHPGPPKLV